VIRGAALLAVAALLCVACMSSDDDDATDKHIVFDQGTEVWIADANGDRQRRLTRGSYGLVSPDGRLVAFQRRQEIHVVEPDGSGQRRLGPGEALEWLPDSRGLLVSRNGSLLVVGVEDGEESEIAGDAENLYGVDLSPDGRSVVYASGPGPRNDFCAIVKDVHVASLDGGSPRQITHDGRSLYPVWMAEGIAFSRFPKGSCRATGIWLVQPDGSGARRIARPPRRYTFAGYYGLRPYASLPDGRGLLIGIRSEWGDVAATLEPGAKLRRLRVHLGQLSQDGRDVLGVQGGAEFRSRW
jgi:dipeptidyl aminopeptidase/acylaminoacyl peptidase